MARKRFISTPSSHTDSTKRDESLTWRSKHIWLVQAEKKKTPFLISLNLLTKASYDVFALTKFFNQSPDFKGEAFILPESNVSFKVIYKSVANKRVKLSNSLHLFIKKLQLKLSTFVKEAVDTLHWNVQSARFLNRKPVPAFILTRD